MWGLPAIRAPTPTSMHYGSSAPPARGLPAAGDTCATPSIPRRVQIYPGSPATPTRQLDSSSHAYGETGDTGKSWSTVTSTCSIAGTSARSMSAICPEAGSSISTNRPTATADHPQQAFARCVPLHPASHCQLAQPACGTTPFSLRPATNSNLLTENVAWTAAYDAAYGTAHTSVFQGVPFWQANNTTDCVRTAVDQATSHPMHHTPLLLPSPPLHYEDCIHPSTPKAASAMQWQANNPFLESRQQTSTHPLNLACMGVPTMASTAHLPPLHRLAQSSAANTASPVPPLTGVYDPMEALLQALTPINTTLVQSPHTPDYNGDDSPCSFRLSRPQLLSRCNSWGSLASEPPGVAACNMYAIEDVLDSSSPSLPQPRSSTAPVLQLPGSPVALTVHELTYTDEQDINGVSTPRAGIPTAAPGAPKKPSAVWQPPAGSSRRALRFDAGNPHGCKQAASMPNIHDIKAGITKTLRLNELDVNREHFEQPTTVLHSPTSATAIASKHAPAAQCGETTLVAYKCASPSRLRPAGSSNNKAETPTYDAVLVNTFLEALDLADCPATSSDAPQPLWHALPQVRANSMTEATAFARQARMGPTAQTAAMEYATWQQGERPGGRHKHGRSSADYDSLSAMWRRLHARFTKHIAVPV